MYVVNWVSNTVELYEYALIETSALLPKAYMKVQPKLDGNLFDCPRHISCA